MWGHNYFVYILTNKYHSVLYTGVTNDLRRRIEEHKEAKPESFTGKYKVHNLVYWERFSHVEEAIAREKQIKGGSRAKKIALIELVNPEWKDLSENLD
ncbi:MAG: GIY-YIG nuclease family protein [Proteobacteria bacterium]|nr:MAG: GIY-YIG nuclease family protein [Pseudomonadota bacterium]